MHPISNIRGVASSHLARRKIVLGVCGSIAAVSTVQLARELARHGAEVFAVMTPAAMGIIHPNALQFATGNSVVTALTGNVEHVALLGEVADRCDLLLVAPATADFIGKMAHGMDDDPVTTCATVAVGTGVPIVVAPAMHEAMLNHPIVSENLSTLRAKLGVVIVDSKIEEAKAKLADTDAIVAAVIATLSSHVLKKKKCLVIGGATAESVDEARILTNRSSGRTALDLVSELTLRGAEVDLLLGQHTVQIPTGISARVMQYNTHESLQNQLAKLDLASYDQIWMPAAIADYTPVTTKGKIRSGQEMVSITLRPVSKIIVEIRDLAPNSTLVAFKAEPLGSDLLVASKKALSAHRADFIVANHTTSFGSGATKNLLVGEGVSEEFVGEKRSVFSQIIDRVSQ